eukprot:TRINITY_DN5386_c0_g1_i3.p1 TRINITY_DN5386_c0_g1~~TRINITY_DN5386_c0_g1_i3.p1  ORF type:complete len:281 (-),score=12.56 TRINITY_DN5386_c0_g1_i3:627-1469(-)
MQLDLASCSKSLREFSFAGFGASAMPETRDKLIKAVSELESLSKLTLKFQNWLLDQIRLDNLASILLNLKKFCLSLPSTIEKTAIQHVLSMISSCRSLTELQLTLSKYLTDFKEIQHPFPQSLEHLNLSLAYYKQVENDNIPSCILSSLLSRLSKLKSLALRIYKHYMPKSSVTVNPNLLRFSQTLSILDIYLSRLSLKDISVSKLFQDISKMKVLSVLRIDVSRSKFLTKIPIKLDVTDLMKEIMIKCSQYLIILFLTVMVVVLILLMKVFRCSLPLYH